MSSLPTSAVPPKIFFGENELYDSIMGQIEPELTSAMVPTLKEKYASETPEEKAERAKRYENAYARYEEMFTAHHAAWTSQFNAWKHAARASTEAGIRDKELNDMTSLEQSISLQ